MQFTIPDAQQRLPELLDSAQSGTQVEIIRDGWIYKLVAVPPRARPPVTGIPKAGRWKGQLVVPSDFKEPLEEMREYME